MAQSPPHPPQDRDGWLMLGIVAVVAFAAHILKVVSRGDPFTRHTAARHIARAALTGLVAAGVWSGIAEFRVLNPATAVAVAAAVAMLGTDYLERVLEKFAEKKLGVKADETPPEPESTEVKQDAGKPGPDVE